MNFRLRRGHNRIILRMAALSRDRWDGVCSRRAQQGVKSAL
jgi:hypothetical protein